MNTYQWLLLPALSPLYWSFGRSPLGLWQIKPWSLVSREPNCSGLKMYFLWIRDQDRCLTFYMEYTTVLLCSSKKKEWYFRCYSSFGSWNYYHLLLSPGADSPFFFYKSWKLLERSSKKVWVKSPLAWIMRMRVVGKWQLASGVGRCIIRACMNAYWGTL